MEKIDLVLAKSILPDVRWRTLSAQKPVDVELENAICTAAHTDGVELVSIDLFFALHIGADREHLQVIINVQSVVSPSLGTNEIAPTPWCVESSPK